MNRAELLASLRQNKEDGAALRECWETYLTADPPSDFELRKIARQFPLDYLIAGMEAYAAETSKKEELRAKGLEPRHPATTANALSYICAVAWNLRDKESPGEERPATARRERNAERKGQSQ